MAYSARVQATGVQILFNGQQVGGWNVKERHFYILGTFAEANASRLRAFKRELEGVERITRPSGISYYWKLPESCLQKFREAVEVAAGEKMKLG